MPTKLKQLKVTSVDFVNAGANPGAKISIFKSASEKPEAKKIFDNIAKAAGVNEDIVLKVLSAVATQGIIDTNQPKGAGAINVSQPLSENKPSDVGKANDGEKDKPIPDSPDDSAEKEVDNKFSDFANKETEEKKVGKQLTDTEKAILKNFADGYDPAEIAKCLGFNVSLSNTDGTLTVSAGAGTPDDNKPAEVQNSDALPDVSLIDAEKCGGVKKGANSSDEIKKSAEQPATPAGTQQTPAATGLTKILADLTDRLQNKIEKAEDKEFEEVAKKYEILGYKAEELAKELKKGKKESPDLYDMVIKALDSAVEAVEKSGTFSEVGKRGSGFAVNAEAQVEQMASEIRKNDPTISYHKAKDMVFQQHPELIEAFDN